MPERRAKNGDLITQNEGGDNNNTESTPHPRYYMSCFIKKSRSEYSIYQLLFLLQHKNFEKRQLLTKTLTFDDYQLRNRNPREIITMSNGAIIKNENKPNTVVYSVRICHFQR